MPLIELSDVYKVFKTSGGDYLALKGIDLGFEAGEFTAIMGKSGSGKSTLINMITGIDHPTSGLVQVAGSEIHEMKEGKLAEWRGRNLGIVFQFFQLLPTLTLLENTMLPMDFCNMYLPAERESRAMELLKLLGLEEMSDKLPAAVSGGQQQIAAIARALANDPPILVADEPTGNLDSNTAELVLGIFEDLAAQSKTILIVTHDPALARRATRRVLISDGELINEMVAHALPMLSHSQLLKLTHQADQRSYAPGSIIARQGVVEDGLYVISRGKVEVCLACNQPDESLTGIVLPGDYFSELEMLETQSCDLKFRASQEGPVEALVLSREDFYDLIGASAPAERSLRQAAVQRSAQYCPLGNRPKRTIRGPRTRRFIWRK
jgi:putative ABC transport system ATP-binding protein